MLPLFAIRRILPMGSDRMTVFANRALVALPETWRFAPYLPNTIVETHFISSGNTPRVKIEHGIILRRIITTNHPTRRRGTGWFVTLAHNEKTGILQPLKSDMPFHCVRW